VADVSFLVGLLIEKFQYHLPLCRQHQRLSAAGVTLSRATLTNLVRRAITLLEPIVYGDRDEIVFTYSDSRARRVIEQILNDQFTGTLISDGYSYSAYASYTAKAEGITHAQCWVHTRRQFFDAKNDEPELVDEMLEHNRLATELMESNPDVEADLIFEATRNIVIA